MARKLFSPREFNWDKVSELTYKHGVELLRFQFPRFGSAFGGNVMSTPSPAARRSSGILEFGLLWLLVLCATVLGFGYLAFSTVKF